MKKLVLIMALSCLIAPAVMAQPSLHLGIKGGANMARIAGEGYDDAYNLSYHLGAFVELGLTKGFGIQPELIFSQSTSKTGTRFSDIYTELPNSNGEKIKLNYLSIPVLANIKFSNALWLQLGPQYSILVNKDESLVENGKDAFKKGDFSAVGGLWLQLPLGLSASARYIVGLSDIQDLPDDNTWQNQAIQLGVGFRF